MRRGAGAAPCAIASCGTLAEVSRRTVPTLRPAPGRSCAQPTPLARMALTWAAHSGVCMFQLAPAERHAVALGARQPGPDALPDHLALKRAQHPSIWNSARPLGVLVSKAR